MNKRKAIITGSINYKKSPLDFPEKDIQLISNILETRCHFNEEDIYQILVKSGDNSNFRDKINNLCQQFDKDKTNSYDLILFYYSGHGMYNTIKGKSCLQISDEHDVEINEIIEIISSIKSKNKYIIVDACQSGGFSFMQPKGKIQRQYTYNSEGIYCMFGATKNMLAFEPTMKDIIKKKINNSYYTHFIVEALNTKSNYIEGTISIKVVDDYASRKTPQYTNFEQIPFSTTESSGFFPFAFWEENKELDDIKDWQIDKSTEENYSFDHEVNIVDYLVEKIKKLYTDKDFYLFTSDNELLRNLSEPAVDLLNEKLSLDSKKIYEKPLINGLLSSSERKDYNFLIFILENDRIKIDMTLTDDNGNSALKEAINNNQNGSNYIIQLLFKRGYHVDSEEENYLTSEFNKSGIQLEVLEKIAMAITCFRLKSKDMIERLRRIERIVFSILSFKVNKVIGYRMNFPALANNFLTHHKEYANVFIKALEKYGKLDELRKKPSFDKKLNEYKDELPYQETEYNDILQVLFPELF